MKNYLNFTIKARNFVPYFFYIIILSIAAEVITLALGFSEFDFMTEINGSYLLSLVGLGVLNSVILTGVLLLFFPMVANSINTTNYKEQSFETDLDMKEWVKVVAKGAILSVITFGIYTPWFMASVVRYFIDGTFHGFNRLTFRGKGGRLFALSVLVLLLPLLISLTFLFLGSGFVASDESMGVGVLLTVVAVLVMMVAFTFYQIYYFKWCLDLTYGNRRVVLGCRPSAIFWTVFGEMMLAVLTLGIYLPMAVLRIYRAVAREVVVGDKMIDARCGMSLRPWNDWAYTWGQLLLSVLTLGIYYPWAIVRLLRRFGSRIYFRTIDKPTETMPE